MSEANGSLLPEDWNFAAKCPKDELNACCFYELLRYDEKLETFAQNDIREYQSQLERSSQRDGELAGDSGFLLPSIAEQLEARAKQWGEIPIRGRDLPWMKADHNSRRYFAYRAGLILRKRTPLSIFDPEKVSSEDYVFSSGKANTRGHTQEVLRDYRISMDLEESDGALAAAFIKRVHQLRTELSIVRRAEVRVNRPEWKAWLKAIGAARVLEHCAGRWEEAWHFVNRSGEKPLYQDRRGWNDHVKRLEEARSWFSDRY